MNKKLILCVITLAALSFFAGLQFSSLKHGTIKESSIVIQQSIHKWDITGSPSLTVTAYAKNTSNKEINAAVNFQATLDPTGIEKAFLESLTNTIDDDTIISSGMDTEKFKSIENYLARGKKLLDGKNYEPVSNVEEKQYETSIESQVNFTPGQTQKLTLEFIIPPRYMGHRVKITQE